MSDDKKDDKPAPKVALVIGTGSRNSRALMQDSEPAEVQDWVGVTPDVFGHGGRAWEVKREKLTYPMSPGAAASTVCSWVIEAPWAHPVWHSYTLALAHLRPIEGEPDPWIGKPGASHQFWLFALQRDVPRRPAVVGEALPAMLHPVNFSAQLVAADDDDARAQIRLAVQDIVDMKLSPDTDYIRTWAARFGGEMLKR